MCFSCITVFASRPIHCAVSMHSTQMSGSRISFVYAPRCTVSYVYASADLGGRRRRSTFRARTDANKRWNSSVATLLSSMPLDVNDSCEYVLRAFPLRERGTKPRAYAEINEWKCVDFKCVRKPTKSRLSLTHHANKSSRWAEKKHQMVRESVESVRGRDEVLSLIIWITLCQMLHSCAGYLKLRQQQMRR